MAGNAVIGALRVVLGADSAALEKGLKDAQGKLAAFSANVAKAGAVAGAAFAAAGVAVGVAVKGVIDEADKLGKMGQKFGVPVEQLSALKYAADLSDVSLESLGKGLGKLSKTMVEAAANPTAEAARAFKALGVSAVDGGGKLRSTSDVVADVAGKFEGLKDGAGKTDMAMRLFGKSGADLIPLLNAGKAGLQGMMAEARKLGVVFDTETSNRAQEFNDNLRRLGAVKDGIIVKITAGMLPALQNLSANLVRVANSGDGLKSIGEAIGGMFTWLFNATERLSLSWQRLGVEWQAFTKLFSAVPFTEASRKAWSDFQEAGKETARVLENLKVVQDTAHLADAFGPLATSAPKAAAGLRDVNTAALAGKTALQGILDSGTKMVSGLQAQAASFGLNAAQAERLQFVTQAYSQAVLAGIPITAQWRQAISALGNDLELVRQKLADQQILLAVKTPHELYREELAKNEEAIRRLGLTAEQAGILQDKTANRFGATWEGAAGNVAKTVESLTGVIAKENKAAFILNKAAAIGSAIVNSHLAYTKALAEIPPPFNFAAAAAAAAAGFAAVASIATTGFKTGGSFTVPGGMGGGDRMVMPLALEPGEQVDIWRPGQGGDDPRRGARGAAVSDVTLHLHGVSFSREQLIDMVRGLNDIAPDGYTIKTQMA